LNQYLEVVLDGVPNVFCWSHKVFLQRVTSPFLPDGVHFNRRAQYTLYRSYRGAILKALFSKPSWCVGYVHTEYGLFGEVLPILYKPCEILFSSIYDGYVLTRANLRLRPRYFLVAFYWASGAATLLCAMLDPANIVGLFYLVRFYTYTTISF
jgi:hypothetical protein